jgi:malate dehydrogenase
VREVAIVGAGDLGGAVAHLLANRDVVRTVTLIDDSGRAAAGKALDIAEAAPIEGFSTRVGGTSDLYRAASASVIVIADRFGGGGEWQGEDALMLLKRMTGIAANAVILCAGAAQRELIDRGVGELQLASGRLFGTAPEALAGGARALIALAADGSPLDASIAILGVPPSHTVIAWEDATIGGFRLTGLIDEPARRRLAARIAALWPPGPHALAAAAVKAIDVMAGRSRRTVTCFVDPNRLAGVRMRAAAFPVRLGPTGIVQLVTPSLSAAERVALENAITL